MEFDDDDEMLYEHESEQESSGNESEDEFVDIVEAEPAASRDRQEAEEFPYEVLPADQIVQFMVDCIKEVNAVVQVGFLRPFSHT
jgi:hypothetical protein